MSTMYEIPNQAITAKKGRVTFNVINDAAGGQRTTNLIWFYEEGGLVWYRPAHNPAAPFVFLCPLREIIKFEATK